MVKRVLVIDDEEAIRKCFILALEDTGYQVDTAESGEKGLQMAKKEKYDLVFLDLKMPGLNGVDTLRLLRDMNNHVPIYIITAFLGEFFDELVGAQQDGIRFQVLEKPVSSNQILLATRSVLEQPMAY
jgi:DNA-binding response OmpR family regulator